jgi:hypothetical protein
MDARRVFMATIVVLLCTFILPPTAGAGYDIQLQGDTFRITWTINAIQNLTTYPIPTTVYPSNLNVSLAGDDLTQFSSVLQTSLDKKNPTITVSEATLSLSSNSINTTCVTCLQWLNATASFQIHEPVQIHGGIARYDMSWVPLLLDKDLNTSGVGYNRLGQDYLVTAILPFTQFTPTSDRSLRMLLNGEPIVRIGYEPFIDGIVLFDMSAIRSPLEDWSHSIDLKSQSQTWISPQNGGFRFSATEHIVSENADLVYVAEAQVSTKLTTSLNTVAKGNTLFADFTGGFWDQVSLGIILVSLGVLATTVVIDKHLTSGYRQKRKRDKG